MTDRSPGVWSRLKNRVRFGLATQEVLDRLARIGLVIYPYMVVCETPGLEEAETADASGNERLETRLLDAQDASLIAGIPERPRPDAEISALLSRAGCVVVVDDGEVLAYSWFRRDRVPGLAGTQSLCELPAGWAYLFDMYVRPVARGRRLAVHIRREMYGMLASQGVQHCCSLSLAFNRSTRRFKARLGAVETELRLLLRLKPFPGLDMRLTRKPWTLPTPAVRIAVPRSRAAA